MKPFIFKILYILRLLKFSDKFYFHYRIRRHIKKGDVVIDIGANWGCYTRLFLRWVGKDGSVEAVDPITNMEEKPNLIIWRGVLGNKEQVVKLKQWRNSSGAYKISEDGDIDVWMWMGSSLFNDLDKIDFIKIDVEESELPIIEDMKELIEKHKPMILIETGFIREVLNLLPSYNVLDSFHNEYLLI